jgi:hypothetical protein
MAERNLSQAEADYLIGLEKQRIDDKLWAFKPSDRLEIPLKSTDRREFIVLNVSVFLLVRFANNGNIVVSFV